MPGGKVGMLDVRVSELPELAGKSLKEITMPKEILISAILRDGEMIIPHGDTILLHLT